ncbi:MAG: carbamoyltransferase HypF [Victivallales bacterium]|nr:carbamoyltransferase HypF [Victivallales bacterium]
MSAHLYQLYGIVQGVGFRPFVSRLATRLGILGTVSNKGSYVEVRAHASEEALRAFRAALEQEAPPRAHILTILEQDLEEPSPDAFRIIESEHQLGDIFVSPDIATCPNCQQELFDPNNRRFLHPFINCTDCGPRLTILDSMPYDRERTSMAQFPMCPECASEYHSPESRRYDAQPVCCNQCGPELYLLGRPERGRDALLAARKAIHDGKIIAVKGIGGFHLCCNALDETAVALLRERKHRPRKPFAVMVRDLAAARRFCEIPEEMLPILTGPQKPILLLRKRTGSPLAPSVAPGNPTLGLMLPYAPVQFLLFQYNDGLEMPDCLVMTSGNVSDAPICRTDEDASTEIASFCDLILSHNRQIRIRADDSVMDTFEHRPYMIRRSRGYAPLPFLLRQNMHGCVLAVGGELKNCFCIARDSLLYLSPYIGDLSDIRAVNACRESIHRLCELLEAEPTTVACDLHPRYNSTALAEEFHLPVLHVQHHYAHILACMAENNVLDDVIGVSFDGTGYGNDGTIWGGEILQCSLTGFQRLAHIVPFPQAGGDTSSREGWRIAASILQQTAPDDAEALLERLGCCTPQQARLIATMVANRINTVLSTSAGRLFDAAAALLGLRNSSSFEGEAAMDLQFAAERASAHSPLWHEDASFTNCLPTSTLLLKLARARLEGIPIERLAYQFHLSLAEMITSACIHARNTTGLQTCALSGGCFQNTLLTSLCANLLRQNGFHVLLHSLTPPNDGSIALGQVLFALASSTSLRAP